jgi:hypothetical protein
MLFNLGDLIGAIKARQAEIASSLAAGNVASWEAYQRTVGTNLGLQETLDLINKMLKESENDER